MTKRAAYFVFVGLLPFITACSTTRESNPPRTATEELLISTAAERAAGRMMAPFQPGTKVFVDAQYFEGLDTKYTISAIHDQLLKDGAELVADRASADIVIEIRSGAQSIDDDATLVGIPAMDLPVPLSSMSLKTPEIAFFKTAQRIGTSKVAMTAYDRKTGAFRFSVGPDIGFSHQSVWKLFFVFSWETEDFRE